MAGFKNITVFRFSPDVALDVDLTLDEELLEANKLRAVGSLELSTVGFVPVTTSGEYTLRIDSGVLLFAVGIEARILPPAAIAYRVEKKIKSIQSVEKRKVGAKERKTIKEDIIFEMLPQAPVKVSTIHAFFDLKRNRLVVNNATASKAELVVSMVRGAMGSFPAVPMTVSEDAVPPWSAMTRWLTGDDNVPSRLTLGSECELQDKSVTKGAKWRGRNVDLRGEDVQEHLRQAMQVTRLGLFYNGICSFELGEDLVLRKIKLDSDYLADQLEDGDDEDRDYSLRATMFVYAALVRELLDYLSRKELLDIADPEVG